jgi:fructokinase
MAIVFGGPAQHYQVLNWRGDEDEPAVFNALRQADTVLVDEQELLQLFAWYAHVAPEAGPELDGPELVPETVQACAELIGNFSLRGLIVALGARGTLHIGADGARRAAPGVDASDQEAFAAVHMNGGVFSRS